jgi:hypothetical protein
LERISKKGRKQYQQTPIKTVEYLSGVDGGLRKSIQKITSPNFRR